MASSVPFLRRRPEWLALAEAEDVIAPTLPIIDAHHHLWDRPGWRYLLEEFRQDACGGGHHIAGSVYVQCWPMHHAHEATATARAVQETAFVHGVARLAAGGGHGAARVCEGIVGYADLRWDCSVLAEVLDAQMAQGGKRFKGVRQMAAWDPDAGLMNPEIQTSPGMYADPRFRAGFAQLAPRGLRFDAWLFHTQLGELTALARAFPGTPIVLDHLGTPLGIGAYAGRRAEVFQAWSAAMRELARCENVAVKLGGMGMRAPGMGFGDGPAPLSSEVLAESMRPWMHHCIDVFGAGRCMFESNFPVDLGAYSYRTCWNAFKRLAAGASAHERQQLFHGTAARFYGLQDGGTG